MTASTAYQLRFRRVLEYVDTHLDEDLSLDRLSGVAHSSKFHFHRQFSELYGLGVFRYVQLVRLRRASYQLAFRDLRIIEIALASGYDSHEAFSRAFKKAVGQTPSEFREQPRWDAWHATYQRMQQLRVQHMKPENRFEDVKIVNFEGARVAVLQHRGDPERLEDSVRTFIQWRKQHGLPPRLSATFNIVYDDPIETPPEDYRFDLAVATSQPILKDDPLGVIEKLIPAGRCALLQHVGSDALLGESVRYLYSEWLPSSGEEPRDYPLFFQRVRFFPDVAEHEAVTDIYLPLR